MQTSSIRDVELLSTGSWAASTGPVTITRGHLEAILDAANDPEIDAAPIKLGHVDPRFDGEPAIGWITPRRIIDRDRRSTLIGDLVGMPSRLAEIAPIAYRRRSAEILFGLKTAAGKTYAAVLSGLALLGVTRPAVKGLADVLALSTHTGTAEGAVSIPLATGLEDNPTAAALLALACQDAPPERVEALEALAGVRDTGGVPQLEPETAHASHDNDPKESPIMLTESRVRELLKLSADANVEEELTKIAEERKDKDGEATPVEKPAEETPAETPSEEEKTETEPAEEGEKADLSAVVTLSAANLAALQADAAAGRQAAAHLAEQRREATLDDAIRAGRITPNERAAFAEAIKRDEKGTTTLLAGLAPRFPVSELGSNAGDAALSEPAEAAYDSWARETFPDLATTGLKS